MPGCSAWADGVRRAGRPTVSGRLTPGRVQRSTVISMVSLRVGLVFGNLPFAAIATPTAHPRIRAVKGRPSESWSACELRHCVHLYGVNLNRFGIMAAWQ
jgi:hypothetical protein